MIKIFLPYFLLFFIACSKNKNKDKDYVASIITLNTPTYNQAYIAGQKIMITGRA